MSEWKLVSKEKPPTLVRVLLAFQEHWNQVAGYRVGADEYWQTNARAGNSKIEGVQPKWWRPIPEVPHFPSELLPHRFPKKREGQ